MEVRILKAAVTVRPKLLALIEEYMKVIYSKPLRDVWNCLPHYPVRSKYYSILEAKFGEDPDNMTVEQLLILNREIANEIGVGIQVMEVNKGSLVIKWVIQTNKVYQSCLTFLTIPQQSRSDKFLQIGNWVVHLPRLVL